MFIPSDGANYETANSFCDVEYADSYHALRGNVAWTGSDAAKQAALVRATDYIEQVYGQRFVGTATFNSALSWPRFVPGVDTIGYIPDNLKKAVVELALDALAGPLSPNLTAEPQVKIREVAGLKKEFFEAKQRPIMRPVVSGYLAPLLSFNGLNVPVVRV